MSKKDVFHAIKPSTVLILLTPIILFLLYIALYLAIEWGLGISTTFVENSDLFDGESYTRLDETLNRSAWGISLIISGITNLFLLAYCIYFIVSFKNDYAYRKVVLAIIFISGAVIWGSILFADLGGGIAEKLYQKIDGITDVVHFRTVINISAGTGYLSVYFVAVLLSFLCFKVRNSKYLDAAKYLRIYKTVFYIMVTFLSVTIVQLFLQYQWLTIFINNDDIAVKSLTKVYPLIMSVFYVGIVVTLFVPTTELLKRLVVVSSEKDRSAISEAKIHELFPKLSGASGLLENLKSLALFLAPILTVILADSISAILI